jgi:enamine deaminase RidA (YjgF/YER057c/UK114 family)
MEENMIVEEKLHSLGLELPDCPKPVGSYSPLRLVGNIIYTSGQTARINGVRRYVGKIGGDVTPEQGYLSARDACLNCLASMKSVIGDLDRIKTIIKITGFVNGAMGFTKQPDVINGASDLLLSLYGDERGRHARSAVGVADLPSNASVELEMIVEVDMSGLNYPESK